MRRPTTGWSTILLFVAAGLEPLGYGAVFALLAKIQDTYDLPTAGLGLIAGATFAAQLVAQLALARFADRGYTRVLLAAGLGLGALGMLWFGLASELWQFVAARTLLGLGSGMFLPAVRRTLVVEQPERAGELLGRLTSVEVAGFIIGPPVGAALDSAFGLRAPFIVPAILLALCAPAVLKVREPPVDAETAYRPLRTLLGRPGVRLGLVIGAGLQFSVGIFDALWARYLTDLDADTTFIAISLTLFAAPLVFLAPWGGRVGDRYGPARAAVVALFATVPTRIAFALLGNKWLVVAVAAAQVTSFAVAGPGSQATVARASGARLLAAGQGLVLAVGAAAAGIAALGGGALYEAGGKELTWLVTGVVLAALATVGAVWAWRLPAEIAPPEPGISMPTAELGGTFSELP